MTDQTSTAQSQTAHFTNMASIWTPAIHLAQPVLVFQTSDAMASTTFSTMISIRSHASQEPTSTCTCAPRAPVVQVVQLQYLQLQQHHLPHSSQAPHPFLSQLRLQPPMDTVTLSPSLLHPTPAPQSTAWRLYTLPQPSRRSSFPEKHHWQSDMLT